MFISLQSATHLSGLFLDCCPGVLVRRKPLRRQHLHVQRELRSRETMQQKSMSTPKTWMSPTHHLDPVSGANPDKSNLMQEECMSAGDADTSAIWGPKS